MLICIILLCCKWYSQCILADILMAISLSLSFYLLKFKIWANFLRKKHPAHFWQETFFIKDWLFCCCCLLFLLCFGFCCCSFIVAIASTVALVAIVVFGGGVSAGSSRDWFRTVLFGCKMCQPICPLLLWWWSIVIFTLVEKEKKFCFTEEWLFVTPNQKNGRKLLETQKEPLFWKAQPERRPKTDHVCSEHFQEKLKANLSDWLLAKRTFLFFFAAVNWRGEEWAQAGTRAGCTTEGGEEFSFILFVFFFFSVHCFFFCVLNYFELSGVAGGL